VGKVSLYIDVSSDHKSQLLGGIVRSITFPLDCGVKCIRICVLKQPIQVRVFDDTELNVSIDGVKL